MDDLLPVPSEQRETAGHFGGAVTSSANTAVMSSGGGIGKVTVNILHLPEMVRGELNSVEQRFQFDPTVELNTDANAFIVKCILSEFLNQTVLDGVNTGKPKKGGPESVGCWPEATEKDKGQSGEKWPGDG